MGTKFRTMLAPINAPTGDGRRFADGSIELAPTPFPFEWARAREGGHDGAVSVGAVHQAKVMSIRVAVADGWMSQEAATKITKSKVLGLDSLGVFGQGELFDDIDRDEMPRLAEDVAEATHLTSQGVLGPSVDLDSFEGIPVRAGTDEEITWDDIEQAELDGEELKIELLITAGRVRAATLVSIPAFMETSAPLELVVEEGAEAAAAEVTDLALVASITALTASAGLATRPALSLFDPPQLTGPTDITWDYERGQVYGHVAIDGTCHTGYAHTCIEPPKDPAGGAYPSFNRFAVETGEGDLVWAGRLTVGGRHAPLDLSAAGSMAHHDSMTVAADVRMYEDAYGIAIVGAIRPDLDARTRAVLSRRKVSVDWRELSGGLSAVELLALSEGPRQHSEPGFPIRTYNRGTRQTALVASFGPFADAGTLRARSAPLVDVAALAAAMEDERERREQAALVRAELTAQIDADRDPVRAELAGMLGQGGE
jgi:hypothetical protein